MNARCLTLICEELDTIQLRLKSGSTADRPKIGVLVTQFSPLHLRERGRTHI